MKYFDTQLGYVASHAHHFLRGAPCRDLIVNMLMCDLYELHMANIGAMLMSVEESSFNLNTRMLSGKMVNEEDLKLRDSILSMGVFIYKEICHFVEYFSSDASISMLREEDVKTLTEVFPQIESMIKEGILSSNEELPIFKIFSVGISDHPEFKWDDVKIDESDTDFPIDPQKYLDVSDEFLEHYDDQISKQYKPDSYGTLVNQNNFLRKCLVQKYNLPNISTNGDK